MFPADLPRPIWDGAELIGRRDAAGGGHDYAYGRALVDGALGLPVPGLTGGGRSLELRIRGGWIGRRTSSR